MAMKRLDDRDLITEYLKGNEKAFEVLLIRHKDKIFRFIHMKLRDRVLAEDVFQETFVKIINTLKLGSYNEEGKFLPWAMRIAHNLVIDHFRKASKVRMISESSSSREDFNIFDVLSLTDKNIEQKITYDELEKQMVDLIEFLPATQKEILKMRIFQDMSFKDIAESEDISINTALGRMRYALINLRKLIDKHQLVTDI
ncbi:MAG: sigma-70 family RNA polymerase sigma factor [Crocinitomicaceae bacterium]|jgi:RNA polymerase sigma-70 factor, ECF subfamily|nr:sigma-70 family RNA polymerase sigma factor [Crocinitomicaceae bacterium]MDP4684286.1 sigma-70 family RNA polymerase sigma factor [Crocinitomicaceae bacterium]MDP4798184.1 sigma-70 family RNA polymerase sigma factor [Crocinitomicaceae bacterium]MDP4867232.1 sigma-70 family RNA polymerase sigma factor [Crocinitomicaceae bacterium]MDP5009637.1 sigma-70 family RNA polymerase sigma factor [Crocinitomicaceae bacterium]